MERIGGWFSLRAVVELAENTTSCSRTAKNFSDIDLCWIGLMGRGSAVKRNAR